MEQEITLNEHIKQEFPPAHTEEPNTSSIVFYTAEDNSIHLDVKLENETVWLSQQQMVMLFGRDKSVISRHIKNIFEEGELDRPLVVANFATPKKYGRHKDREQIQHTDYYNLDVIISVGYRVKSIQGTRFRQWANKVLKDYLVKGYAVNQKITMQRYEELKDVVRLMSRTYQLQDSVTSEEADGLLTMMGDYVYALDTLDHYDFQQLTLDKTTTEEPFHATYENAMEAINRLKPKFGGSALFANEKDESFKSSIGQIYQTFGGEELYPSVEEKAATLLYLVVKNHSFSDGNKRIAAMLFLWFMDRNKVLYAADGHKRIADNTLVALTLMIAESRPEEKDIIIKLVVNLINQNNQ
ncbi:MAG: virulence protein RhuM/Fic/DOC family protein [Bacteroidales bacterium]|nr:virulence protein RhuM/Fic/DOC family protein [Bacteroidales bacterium]